MFIKIYDTNNRYVGYGSTNFDRLESDLIRDIQFHGIDNISRIDIQLDGKVILSYSADQLLKLAS
jgi:hypothetical protein